MTEITGRVLVVTTGRELLDEITPSMSGRGLELVCVPTLKYAADRLGAGDCTAMVVDFGKVPPDERWALLDLHRENPKLRLFTLETTASNSPAIGSPMRRLSWPLPMGFADQVRVTTRLVVILADQTLFMTGAVQSAFQDAGVRAAYLESAGGLTDFIRKQRDFRESHKPARSRFRLGGRERDGADAGNFTANVVVALFAGSLGEAYSMASSIARETPEAACYFISGMDHYVGQALSGGHPVSLPREQAGRIAGILSDAGGGAALPKGKEGGRVILLDNFKPTLTALTQALLTAGYEVKASMYPEEVLEICKKEAFQLAVIGTSAISAQLTDAELAQKLRELDPDLRIIFMVDQYPLKAALQGVSRVVELGLDDALLKPVEASRLIFSVEKALERRFLRLENERLLKEIQEYNRQLARINDFQKHFFATVAHDVKSPLTAILGYAEVLDLKLKNQPTELRYASNIHSAAKTLNVLISDLVDLAAIESGKLRVEIGVLNLLSVVNDVRARVEIAAQKRDINFITELPPILPPLAGDEARIGQVIQNLCTNAIQYTKPGGRVTIRVEPAPDRVVVSVIDTGIGISKEDLPRVWERFFQTEEAKTMRKAGFGLGLKIAREIVQRHGGEMGIESELGAGSRFFFHLPIKKNPAE